MSDLISREQAVKIIDEIDTFCAGWRDCAINRIKSLPPAEKTGKWIETRDLIENQTFSECKCSECGSVEYFNKGWKRFNYCPNCGALMREVEDE